LHKTEPYHPLYQNPNGNDLCRDSLSKNDSALQSKHLQPLGAAGKVPATSGLLNWPGLKSAKALRILPIFGTWPDTTAAGYLRSPGRDLERGKSFPPVGIEKVGLLVWSPPLPGGLCFRANFHSRTNQEARIRGPHEYRLFPIVDKRAEPGRSSRDWLPMAKAKTRGV